MSCPLPQLLMLSARLMAYGLQGGHLSCRSWAITNGSSHLVTATPQSCDGLWGKHRPGTSKEITPPPLVLNCCFKEDSHSADSWHQRDQSLNTPKWLFQNKDNIGGVAVGNFLMKSQLIKHWDFRDAFTLQEEFCH